MQGKAVGAFNAWVQLVDQRTALRDALRKALQGDVGRAWRRWEECVDELHRLREAAIRVGKRMMNRDVAIAFDSWLEVSDALRGDKDAKLRRAVIAMYRERRTRTHRHLSLSHPFFVPYCAIVLPPHTSHLTLYASCLMPHASHITHHTSHITHHSSHITPRFSNLSTQVPRGPRTLLQCLGSIFCV